MEAWSTMKRKLEVLAIARYPKSFIHTSRMRGVKSGFEGSCQVSKKINACIGICDNVLGGICPQVALTNACMTMCVMFCMTLYDSVGVMFVSLCL